MGLSVSSDTVSVAARQLGDLDIVGLLGTAADVYHKTELQKREHEIAQIAARHGVARTGTRQLGPTLFAPAPRTMQSTAGGGGAAPMLGTGAVLIALLAFGVFAFGR